jgi:hypothetical protein
MVPPVFMLVARSVPFVSLGALYPAIPSKLRPLESALTDELRVLTEIGRNCLSVTPLESALTGRSGCKSFRIRTYEKTRVGGHNMLTNLRFPSRLAISAGYHPLAARGPAPVAEVRRLRVRDQWNRRRSAPRRFGFSAIRFGLRSSLDEKAIGLKGGTGESRSI